MNKSIRTLLQLMTIGFVLCSFSRSYAQTLPSESPQEFKSTNYGLEYERRDVMIPMRDGVKLHTVIIVPKSVIEAKKRAPILLTCKRKITGARLAKLRLRF